MLAATPVPKYFESGTAARRLGLSMTRLHELGSELGVPATRTDGGRRLWTEDEILAIQRAREERRTALAVGRSSRAA